MPTDPHGFHVILQRASEWDGNAQCVGFTGIPVARPIRYLVVATDSAQVSGNRLTQRLKETFAALAKAAASPCSGPGSFGCWATDEVAARNVLVVVAEDAPSPDLEQLVDDWLARPGFETIGVVPADENPDYVLPARMRHDHAVLWDVDPAEAAGELADLALGLEERRAFVSYSHKDGRAIADRLFDVLGRRRFDVFLDRFRLEPGSDFGERIEDELIDKAMVVVVETPESLASEWVKREVRIANKRRLSVIAVNLHQLDGLDDIAEIQRCRVNDDDAIGDFVVDRHRVGLMERRRSLMESVWCALSAAGVPAQEIAEHWDGFTVDAGSGSGCEVAVRTRPADLHQFRRTAERAEQRRPIMVHPPPALPRRQRDLQWLSSTSGVDSVDEGVFASSLADIVSGRA